MTETSHLIAPNFTPESAALNFAVKLLRQHHEDWELRHSHLSATDGDVDAIRAAVHRLADMLADPASVDYAIRVTLRDGAVSVHHEDEPFTERSVAERFAWHARLGSEVAFAEVVCRNVWHGPWVTAGEVKPS